MSKERELTSIRIRQKMDELNLSYRELSELTGINKSSLQRYVSNVSSKIPMDNARLIAKAFKVDLSWLIGMDEEQKDDIQVTPDHFTSPEQAMQFIVKQPMIALYGGYDLDKMTDDEIIEFANTVLDLLKIAAKQIK